MQTLCMWYQTWTKFTPCSVYTSETASIKDSPIHHWVKNLASPPLSIGYGYWLCKFNSTQWEWTITRMLMHAHQKHATIQIRNMTTQHYSTHNQQLQQHMITTNHEHITLITTHGINIQHIYTTNISRITTNSYYGNHINSSRSQFLVLKMLLTNSTCSKLSNDTNYA